MKTSEKIAFVGLGQMGLPFACNLVAAGFRVKGVDTSEAARQAFVSSGGEATEHAGDAVSDADVVITMLPNGEVVRAFLTSPDLLAAIKPKAMIVDMSSSEPVGTRKLGKVLAEKSLRFIDAPDLAPVSPDTQAVAIWAAMNSRGERILSPECG